MIKIGISQGDINGIGLEVILKTFSDPAMLDICQPVLFSSGKTVSFHRKALNMEEVPYQIVRDLDQLVPKKLNVMNLYDEEVQMEIGKSTPNGGKYALRSLEAACDAVQNGKVDVLVTAPINKHNIQSDVFRFAGHTDYLQMRFGAGKSALMLMCSENMRVGVVTGHIPLGQVASAISTEKIIQKVQALAKTLQEDFRIRKPKIAVLGLNPHAGDSGTIGNEEQQVILPAINRMKEEDMMVFGPYPADGFFGSSTYAKFDAVLAMYHDQGLVPFKALSFSDGVNFTAGLSIIRTSPDHGTAYDIAGQNQANPSSFRKAVYMAIDIYNTRNEHAEITANPLKSNPIKKEGGRF
ncbi:MAG: 4-hydroxythreonine-4-phosphate dehydrogenase PdxA [Bacteroidota bacterium]